MASQWQDVTSRFGTSEAREVHSLVDWKNNRWYVAYMHTGSAAPGWVLWALDNRVRPKVLGQPDATTAEILAKATRIVTGADLTL